MPGIEANIVHECFPATVRLSREPLIEILSAGDSDLFEGNPVQPMRFFSLGGIPDENAVWISSHEALGGQIVPARDTERAGNAQLVGNLEVLGLDTPHRYQRSYEKYIGLLVFDGFLYLPANGYRLVQALQDADA